MRVIKDAERSGVILICPNHLGGKFRLAEATARNKIKVFRYILEQKWIVPRRQASSSWSRHVVFQIKQRLGRPVPRCDTLRYKVGEGRVYKSRQRRKTMRGKLCMSQYESKHETPNGQIASETRRQSRKETREKNTMTGRASSQEATGTHDKPDGWRSTLRADQV